MMRFRVLRALTLTGVAGVLAVVAPASSWAAGLEETRTFDADRLEVRNLLGEVRIEPHGGSSFEVVVRAAGAGAGAGSIRVESGADRLDVKFPASAEGFVYPALGHGKHDLDLSRNDLTALLYGTAEPGRVRVRGAGEGLELWADVTVRVPRGGRLSIRQGVGAIRAGGVDAELELSAIAGDVLIDGSSGDLEVATGSGSVSLVRVRGERVEVATGSGRISVEDGDGRRVSLATGSGGVDITGLRGGSIEVGVGSGNVKAEQVGAETLEIGSGSGDIELRLDSTSRGKISLGTGSGDIALDLPPDASAELHAETSSGEIELDLGNRARISQQEPDEVRLTVGAGEAEVELGSGSGDIRIRG